jgi:hypothetical protein
LSASKTVSDIFISYARPDRARAQMLAKALEVLVSRPRSSGNKSLGLMDVKSALGKTGNARQDFIS